MPKIKYFAIDPNGERHTRSSERVYSHAVVYKDDYAKELANASDKGWTKTDRSNFDYNSRIAAGNDPYPHQHWDRVAYAFHEKTDEWIAAHDARMDRENAERLADAKAAIEGHDAASYCEAKRLARVAKIEAKKAAGGYDVFRCAGWCGRLDLAHKLAAKGGVDTTILPAQS